MAIQFARARYISRASGGNAVRSAAYNAREAIEARRTGELFYFRHRDGLEHHEVLLPDAADRKFRDSGVLWNAAEAAEKRRDAQVAREIVLALPADAALTDEDRVMLARSFAQAHFVSKGLAVQLDVHRPHEARGEGVEGAFADGTGGDHTNWHAHLLITTRRLEGDRFSAKKARDLDPAMRQAAGKAFVAEGESWGELWRAHQEAYFREQGLDVRVDDIAAHPGQHIGPVRMRRAGSEAVARAEVLRAANEAAARDPARVLETLTRNNASFDARDLDRFLARHIEAVDERAAIRSAVLAHPEVLALHDRATGEVVGRWTTRSVRAQEIAALADGAALAGSGHQVVPANATLAAMASRSLRDDQAMAVRHAVGTSGLALIEGRAGTGKSYALQAVREAHERAGFRVIGLAPTNTVAQDLKAAGFAEAGTVHSELFRLRNARTVWDRRTVIIVDEAAMLDSPVTGALLAAARSSGAKVILSGDDRQLASIERGGLFSELKARHGAAEIFEVTRQRVDWQRAAARDLAEGRFVEAVAAFDRHGAIIWTPDEESARVALVAAWRRDLDERPGSRFVFAYTNADVDAFNGALRAVRRERGELVGDDVVFQTKYGRVAFAVGDRVQLTDTLKSAGLFNGSVGTITGLDAATGQVSAVLDGAGGGRVVTWSAGAFDGFRHGYAGTIYRGQGRTLDHTYLFHTHHWRSAASYVALTRQRESAQVFVSTDTARDAAQLARQMARGEVRAASVAWATAEEIAAAARMTSLAARVASLRADAARLQAGAAERLRDQAEAIERRRAAGEAPASLPDRFRQLRGRRVLSDVLDVATRVMAQGEAVFQGLSQVFEALPQAVRVVTERVAAEAAAQRVRQEALRQHVAAGVERARDHYRERRRQLQAEAARDDQARQSVQAWNGLAAEHGAALPGIEADPTLKGTRERMIQLVDAVSRQPEMLQALRTRGPEFGAGPDFMRVLADPSPKRAVVALLDGLEAPQRAVLKEAAERRAEAERKAEQEARMRRRSSPSPGF